MGEQAPQYHQIIEDNLEISGPNIGAVKKNDLAQDLALNEDGLRSFGAHEEAEKLTDDTLKATLAKEAIASMMPNLAHNIAAAAATPEDTLYTPEEHLEDIKAKAADVIADYGSLQEAAKEARKEEQDA